MPLDPAAQMRQKLNIEPPANSSIAEQIKQGVPLSQLRNPPPSGESQFPPPASVYETEPQFSGAMRDRFCRPVDDAGIQEMMQDRFSRDEAVNESQIMKRQAAGNSMDNPKGVQADQFAASEGKAPKTPASQMSTDTRNRSINCSRFPI